MTDWTPPPLGPDDQLVEAKVVFADGSSQPIVLILTPVRTDDSVGYAAGGYSRPLDLPPGATLEALVPVPPGAEHAGHVDAHREDDDAGIIYRGACGDYHWRCYECEPPRRSGHLASQEQAVAAFEAHQAAEHP